MTALEGIEFVDEPGSFFGELFAGLDNQCVWVSNDCLEGIEFADEFKSFEASSANCLKVWMIACEWNEMH